MSDRHDIRAPKPGRPGVWGTRAQRWRQYRRNMRRVDPASIGKIADAEIAIKRRHARFVTSAVLVRNLIIAAAVVGGIYLRCAR